MGEIREMTTKEVEMFKMIGKLRKRLKVTEKALELSCSHDTGTPCEGTSIPFLKEHPLFGCTVEMECDKCLYNYYLQKSKED